MLGIIYKIWYTIFILPVLIFIEGNVMLGSYLKKKNIYIGWDGWHGLLFVLIVLLIVLWFMGYR